MKLTKYAHACVILEEKNEKIIIDPGAFTDLPADLTNVKAVIITHIHDDHVSVENIQKVIAASPDAEIIAGHDVLEKIGNIASNMVTIGEYSVRMAGNFRLELFVDDHAIIYETVPCKNMRVLINEQVYHPGDSLIPYEKEIMVACTPLSAPWSKVNEVIKYIQSTNAKQFVPIHDALLSELGAQFYNSWMSGAAQRKGVEYVVLNVGVSLDV